MQSLESKWISEHPKIIDQYSGKWIAVLDDKGIIACGDTVKEVQKELVKRHIRDLPLITKIPTEEAIII